MVATTRTTRGIKSRTRRLLVIFLLVPLGLIAGLLLALRSYANPEFIRSTAEKFIQEQTTGRVEVRGAQLSWTGSITLNGLSIFEAIDPSRGQGGARRARPIFSCENIQISQRPLSALRGKLDIHSIILFEPVLEVVRDVAGNQLNLQNFFRPVKKKPAAKENPAIELRNARVRLVERTGTQEKPIEDLTLTIRGRFAPRNPPVYDVVWQSSNESGGYLQYNMDTGGLRNVRGGLPSISVASTAMLASVFSKHIEEWGPLLQVRGRVSISDFGMSSSEPSANFFSLKLDGGSFSVPVDDTEKSLPDTERYLTFTDVDGTWRVTSDKIEGQCAGFSNGAKMRLGTTVLRDGSEPQKIRDAFANLVVENLVLPSPAPDSPGKEKRFIQRWDGLHGFFRRYDPHGVINAELTLEKPAQRPARISKALITALDGDAYYHGFPYRAYDVAGVMELDDEGFWIRNLCGRHGDGRLCVKGWLETPERCSPAKVDVSGDNLILDDDFFAGIGTRYANLREQLSPKGAVDLAIYLERGTSEERGDVDWDSRVSVALHDVSAMYEGFPYPLLDLNGTIDIHGEKISLENINGRAGGGSVSISGEGSYSAVKKLSLDLEVIGKNVSIEEQLLAALPQKLSGHIASFHPKGKFDIHTTTKFQGESGVATQHSDVMLRDVSVLYDKYPIPVTELIGQLQIGSDEITVIGVSGKYGQCMLTLGGAIKLGAERGALNLALGARDLLIKDEVRAVVPERLREALGEWDVQTPIDADLYFQRAAGQEDSEAMAQGEVRLIGDRVRHQHFPHPFEHVKATIRFDGSSTQADNVELRYGGVSMQGSFSTQSTDAAESGNIRFTALGLPLDRNTRSLLPQRLQNAWDEAVPSGRVNVELEALEYLKSHFGLATRGAGEPNAMPARGTWRVRGRVDLMAASFKGYADAQKISGSIFGEGYVVDPGGGTALEGRIRIENGEIYDRMVTNVAAPWTFAWGAGGEGQLRIENFNGSIYDGSLAGRAQISFDGGSAAYDLSTTVHGMQLAPFVNSGRGLGSAARRNPEKPIDVRGQVFGQLFLSGTGGQPDSRRGGGRVEIREGYISKVPLLLAVFQVLRMSLPNTDTIDEAEAEFFVVGNKMTVRELLLQGGGLTLGGSGSITLPDGGVDLTLVNEGSQSPLRVPLIADLLEGATRELAEIHVSGPLSHPVARARPLPGLNDEMKRLFQRRRTRPIEPQKN